MNENHPQCLCFSSFFLLAIIPHCSWGDEAIIFKGNEKASPEIAWIGKTQIKVWQRGKENYYYYVPPAVTDWNAYQESIDNTCSEQAAEELVVSLPFNVQFYNDSVVNDIENSLISIGEKNVQRDRISVVPFISFSVFVETASGTVSIYDSGPPSHTLAGLQTAQVGSLPRSLEITLNATCSGHSYIREKHELNVVLIAVANAYKSNSVSAVGSFLQDSSFMADVASHESEIEKVTVSGTSKSSGFGVKLGPVKIGSGKSGFKSTSSTENSRIVSRDWMTGKIANFVATLDYDVVCEIVEECSQQDIQSMTSGFIDSLFAETRATIAKSADDLWILTAGAVSSPAQLVQANKPLKSSLDHALELSSNEEVSIPIEGATVKVKKIDSNTITLNGSNEWTKDGEDWIPTKFDAYVVDVSEFRVDVRTSYGKTLLGAASKYGYPLVSYYSSEIEGAFSNNDLLDEIRSAIWYDNGRAINPIPFVRTTSSEDSPLEIPNSWLRELCQDLDGCEVQLMYYSSYHAEDGDELIYLNRPLAPLNVPTKRLFIDGTGFWSYGDNHVGKDNSQDNNNIVEHRFVTDEMDGAETHCYFTDAEQIGTHQAPKGSDGEVGFRLYVRHRNAEDSPNRYGCTIAIRE